MPSKTNKFKIRKASHGEKNVGEWLNRKTLNSKKRKTRKTPIKDLVDVPKLIYKSWQSKEDLQKMKRYRRAQLNPPLANVKTNKPRFVKPRKK